MKAHIPEEALKRPNIQEILANNELMESVFENLGDGDDAGLRAVFSALALPEREFALVSGAILENFEKGINNANDKLMLVQALNANGMKAEDLTDFFIEFNEKLEEEMNNLSQQKIDFLKRFVGIMVNAINDTQGIAKKMVQIPIELCHPDAQMPTYANPGDAGMDVYAVEDVTINPGETKLVPTGIKCALPRGYMLDVRPRSGLSLKTPLRIANAPGTIDSGYRDEIGIIVTNSDPVIKELALNENGTINKEGTLWGGTYTITKGMRFAQLVLQEVPSAVWYEVEKVDTTNDREGGFGSTGVG